MPEHNFYKRVGKRPRAARLPRYVEADCQGTMRDGWPCERRAHWEVFLSVSERDDNPMLAVGETRLLACGICCRSIFKRWERENDQKAEDPAKRHLERAIKWVLTDPRIKAAKIAREIDFLGDGLRRFETKPKRGDEISPSYRKEKAGEAENTILFGNPETQRRLGGRTNGGS